jgi:hypothetical protein
MRRRLLVAVACAAFAAAVVVPAATADPINAKGSAQIIATCGGATPITVVVNGNGTFTPGHVVGSTSVFIPTRLDLTLTFTPAGGSPEPMTQMAQKAGPAENTVMCTIPVQTLFSGPEGMATIQGTVWGFFTPR